MHNISLTDFKKIIDSLSFDFIHEDICCIKPHRDATFYGSVEKELTEGEYMLLAFKYYGSWNNNYFILERVFISCLEIYKDEHDKYHLDENHKCYVEKVIEDYINSI